MGLDAATLMNERRGFGEDDDEMRRPRTTMCDINGRETKNTGNQVPTMALLVKILAKFPCSQAPVSSLVLHRNI